MKKISLLFTFVCVLLLTSCNNDDNESTNNSQLIIGTWEFFQESETTDGSEQLEDYQHYSSCGRDNIEFFADGTFEDEYFEFSSSQCHNFNETGTLGH